MVKVKIDASNHGDLTGSGSSTTTVHKQQAVALTVDLVITTMADLGMDLAMPDMAVPDLRVLDLTVSDDLGMEDLATTEMAAPDLAGEDSAMPQDLTMLDGPHPDGAMPDQVMVDLTLPDLTSLPDLVCDPSCVNGTYTYCDKQNMKVAVPCGFGCNGPQCNGPNSCMTAGDISNPGTYWGTTLGAAATATGSCQVVGGPDNTLKFTTKAWNKVTLALNASFPAAMWVRGTTCNDPKMEYVANGLCNNMALAPACLAGSNMETLVLCGIPQGANSYAFVEHPAGPGGLYSITTSYSALTLNDCPNAGMLPGSSFSYTGDTSGQQPMQTAPMGPLNCGGDRGAAAPEMVFWVPIGAQAAGKTLTVTVTGLNGYVPFLYVQNYCQPASTVCFNAVNGVAKASFANVVKDFTYFFFVDGLNGAKGQFKLDMTLL